MNEPSRVPLTDLTFAVLVELAGGPSHGYALVKNLRDHEGRADLRTGTLYAALARLEDDGLIEPTGPPAEEVDQRRQYYRITERGRSAAQAEAERLQSMVDRARMRDLLSGAGGA